MDINEVTGKQINRHPWELSRTRCVYKELYPYINRISETAEFVSIGAGDMYFDKHILNDRPHHVLHAVDIGYATDKIDLVKTDSDNIRMYNSLEDVGDKEFDYGLMLDSLEYMPDDAAYLNDLCSRIKEGGYLFLTLPAFRFMYSKHDEIVGNLRRYGRKDIKKTLEQVPGIKLVRSHYFYFSLFLFRLLQKVFRVDIDPEHKVTTGWEHTEDSFVTRMTEWVLNTDYAVGKGLSRIGIHLPGLSLLAVCQKISDE